MIEAFLDAGVCECVAISADVKVPKTPINSLIMKRLKTQHLLL